MWKPLDQERKERKHCPPTLIGQLLSSSLPTKHTCQVHDDTIWTREGLLDHLARGERRAAGWRRLVARRSLF